ncbi:hypothetical protein BN1723_016210 [Verticillium longisporum]|uniref:isopentenyl-diphosphate Delta-isomerase n=1 Tax=Verticillium longisporum TaxID=100787 RepID=A0A0G4NAL7_VERLO|nr:hypothetical protein BN1723_016210 [Verticillium longisporum]
MADGRPISPKASSREHPFSSSWTGGGSWIGTPRAEDIVARDLAELSEDDDAMDNVIDSDTDLSADEGPTLYRRPSGVAYGTLRPVMNPQTNPESTPFLTRVEKKQSRDAERSLLRDNHVLPPKRPRGPDEPFYRRVYRRLFSTKVPRQTQDDEEIPRITVQTPDEATPLLGGADTSAAAASSSSHAAADGHENLTEQWEAAVASGTLRTTWQREAKTIISYALPLVGTFMLQYSINVVSIFTVGRIGRLELGAVSLATMTATITCYAPFQGLATSLDTLCAQAYGSGHRHLVGLQLQRMIFFLLLSFIPVAVLWYHSDAVLALMIPEPESARLVGQYLRVLIFGGPAFVCFEGGKRFVQAQGLFQATTWVLLVVAPFNVFINWFLNRLLLQQRASEKITFPDMWTNTCCSHPLGIPGEGGAALADAVAGVKRAAQRKLEHELGIPIEQVPTELFRFLTRIHYKAPSDGKWGEHEIDYILFIKANVTLDVNKNEVQATQYVSPDELKALFQDPKLVFTPWFKLICETMLFEWWAHLDAGLEPYMNEQEIRRM